MSSHWIFAASVLASALTAEMHANADTEKKSCAYRTSPFITVAKRCIPCVVFIRNESCSTEEGVPFRSSPFDQFGDDLFQRFFGMPPNGPKAQPELRQGSGFFVSPDGYIMTNAHVVKGADKLTVVFDDGRELDATVVGSDPQTDIAIIKVDGKNFPYLELADSDKIEVGEEVAAIGSPFQLQATLTSGIISAKGRQNLHITAFEDFIQTDAAINPGNSGGPLVNLDCQVIGINTAIVTAGGGGYVGIGFAVPSNMAKNVMTQLMDTGVVVRSFLGVALQPVDKDIADAFRLDKVEGALVSEVIKDSPADKAGIKQGDIILECNGAPIKSIGSFRNEISLMTPNTSLQLKINRKGNILVLPVTLETSSENVAVTGGIVQKLGVEVEPLTSDLRSQLGLSKAEEGIVITKVKPGSPAAQAGLRPGFLILAVNHKKINNINEFNESMSDPASSKRVLLLVKSGSITRFYSIKLS
ncbi:MAG: Do family serine endopeptidase [Chlamydiota bacterium]